MVKPDSRPQALSVAISGASSFTGAWICRAFAKAEWQVAGLCSKTFQHEYEGLRAKRVEFASQVAQLSFGVRAEDGTMPCWIEKNPAQIWVHHHHWMQNFRSTTYDLTKATAVGLEPLRIICRALKNSGYRGVIFSGSYFEPGEGGNLETGGETPYAKSKKAVWHALEEEAYVQGLIISKVVVPDPVGPLENEDRVIPLMVNKALGRGEFRLRQETSRADHIPVGLLAQRYVEVAQTMLNDETIIARPSGFKCTNLDWANTINRELIKKRLAKPALDLSLFSTGESDTKQTAPVTSFENRDDEKIDVDWSHFWSNYAHWINTGVPWS